jgi:uncharacterized membrane protein YraQ (UPF0718 family)
MKLPKFTKSLFRNYLSGYWTIFASIYLVLVTFVPIPEVAIRFVDTILGFIMGTIIATIINYYLGNKEHNNEVIQTFEESPQISQDSTLRDRQRGL